MKYIRTVAVLMCLSGCTPGLREVGPPIVVVNNSDRRINVAISVNYPDTSLSDVGIAYDTIYPHAQRKMISVRSGWAGYINKNPHGILLFFISDIDTFYKYGDEVWQRDYLILKRYELTVDFMEKNNWTVTYP